MRCIKIPPNTTVGSTELSAHIQTTLAGIGHSGSTIMTTPQIQQISRWTEIHGNMAPNSKLSKHPTKTQND